MVRFTFFEVENPNEVIDAGAKPKLVERGPYVYQEDMLKKDIKWTNDSNQFIEFGENYYEKLSRAYANIMMSRSV